MRRLTVVQLLPALHSGGVERSTLEIAAALVAAGYSAPASEGGQVQIRSTNTLSAALNGIWEAAMTDAQKTGAVSWALSVPDVAGMAAQLDKPPARRAAPPAPTVVPDADGWVKKKRAQ
mgnify:CR=1 FL=1